MYHYTECGLDSVYLRNGYEVTDMDGEECVGIHDIEGLHRVIGHCLVGSSDPLEPKEFRFLRIELGLSQTALGDLLGVDHQTIARYEKGHTKIPKPTDALVRALYLESLNEESNVNNLLQSIGQIEGREHIERLELESRDDQWMEQEAC